MIKIEDQLWAVVDQNRAPLAYMTHVSQKKDGSPDAATLKKMETGRKWARNGRTAVYERDENGDVIRIEGTYNYKISHYKEPNEGTEAFYDNVPTKGFKVVGEAGRWMTDATYIEIEDPRGFKVQVPVSNLTTLMLTCDVIKGVIQEECVWGRDDQHILLPVHSKEYAAARSKIAKVEEAVTMKDLKPGDWVKVHSFGETDKNERQFVGLFKLEWLQKSHIFDYQQDGRYTYYHSHSQKVKMRDHTEQSVKDAQWVGLFVTSTCISYGSHHNGTESEYAPGVVTENLSLKIVERRAGELPPEYVGVENINARLATFVSNGYSDGRSDCPERVKKKFDRRAHSGTEGFYHEKNCCEATYFATVSQKG